MAYGRMLQAQTDTIKVSGDELSMLLTEANERMADMAMAEATKLLGDFVKEAFSKERLQF